MVLDMLSSLRHTKIGLAALLAFAGLCLPALGQRVAVVTEARNSLGEAARLTLHSADFTTGESLPDGHVLPGSSLMAPLVFDPAHGGVLASSGQAWRGGNLKALHLESALGAFHVAPFNPWVGANTATEPGWRDWVVGVVEDQQTLSFLRIMAAVRHDVSGAWRGKLQARPWPPEGTPGRVQSPGGDTPLDLAPRFVFPLRTRSFLAVGVAEGGGLVLMQRADPALGTAEPPRPIADGSHPADLRHLAAAALAPEENILWVLFSALALSEDGTTPESWLYAVNLGSTALTAAPLAIPGVVAAGFQALSAGPGGICWVATRTPGTDFGRVARVALAIPGLSETLSLPLVGVEQSLSVAASPTANQVLVAVDSRVQYIEHGENATGFTGYVAPIALARWTESGPVIGEGNRLHRVSLPECTPEATLAFQSGWVADFLEIPASTFPQPDADADGIDDDAERRQQTRPDQADSDGDSIPDGSDPFPSAPSPQLRVGAEVVFPYSAVGRQLRALQIESLGAPDAQWQIDFDAEALPWLRVHPRNFRGSGQAYMGVDPELFDPAGVTSGTIQVSLAGKPKGSRPGYAAAYSPATVHIRVEPPRDPLRTMLWLWPAAPGSPGFRDASDPQDLRALGDLAAGFPYHFSHVEHSGPVSGALDGYSVVVIGARAAAEGVLTQKALFDYLSDGGAVLFLGEHLEGEHYRDLGTWLAPLGVKISMNTPVNGTMVADTAQDLLRHWQSFSVERGCAITTSIDDGVTISAVSPEQVVSGLPTNLAFLARAHGYGRIALLAAPTPLDTKSLQGPENQAFALDLLYWLSRAGYAVDDRDGDGLLDATEDRNDNGAVDGDETNWLDPDSDGDGVPDGLEDTNRNGEVDKGETDPRRPDTDGDGVQDGADGTPLG
jgi:hypothetical protein